MNKAEEPTIAVCNLVSDMPEPYVPAQKVPCSGCSRDVWRAFSTPKTDLDFCTGCAHELMKAQPEDIQIQAPTQAQMNEIREYFRKQ